MRFFLVGMILLSAGPAICQEATFVGVGFLDPLDPRSLAFGVSPDGSVVVGQTTSVSGAEAFRWENGVMVGLGDLPGGVFASYATATSVFGNAVVGTSWSSNGDDEAFRWQSGVMQGLGDLPGGQFDSQAWDVSADGQVVVGSGTPGQGDPPFSGAFRWENGVMEALPDLPGGELRSNAVSVSADGRIVAGSSNGPNGTEAVRWVDGVVEGLGFPPEGHTTSPRDMSANGAVIVGTVRVEDPSGTEAFIWKEGEGMDYIPDLPGGSPFRVAQTVSGNGRVVVGSADGQNGFEAFIWTAELGTTSLRGYLEGLGVDLTGWDLGVVGLQGTNFDGTVIVGAGNNPDGIDEGWIAVLPAWPVANTPSIPETNQLTTSVYPNPVRDRATVRVVLGAPSEGRVAVSNVLGREVAVIHNGPLATGGHSISFSARDLPAGVYVIRADFGKAGTASRSVTVLR